MCSAGFRLCFGSAVLHCVIYGIRRTSFSPRYRFASALCSGFFEHHYERLWDKPVVCCFRATAVHFCPENLVQPASCDEFRSPWNAVNLTWCCARDIDYGLTFAFGFISLSPSFAIELHFNIPLTRMPQ